MNDSRRCGDEQSVSFSHIYVEKKALDYPQTKIILDKYKESHKIIINHYKDVFCRRKQIFSAQKNAPQIILAVKEDDFIYAGAKVCQSFANEYFYYTSCVMNCIYDCEYCYLQGMYPSANIVIFVNIEDYFKAIKKQLKQHNMYVCVSYDTDIAAMDAITGYTKLWFEFVSKVNAASDNSLSIEIRTKSAAIRLWKELTPSNNIILAYTLSPQEIITAFEHGTPSLQNRIKSINTALDCGYSVRICFDPVIYVKNYKEIYVNMLNTVTQLIDLNRIKDISIGSFRVSVDFLKKMRKNRPDSIVLQYPYINEAGYYHYDNELARNMTELINRYLLQYINADKIFIWEP